MVVAVAVIVRRERRTSGIMNDIIVFIVGKRTREVGGVLSTTLGIALDAE
jgi:hypothetical protein